MRRVYEHICRYSDCFGDAFITHEPSGESPISAFTLAGPLMEIQIRGDSHVLALVNEYAWVILTLT
jgi:hypothetical protein